MAEHEPCIGATQRLVHPARYLDALGLIFDLQSVLARPD